MSTNAGRWYWVEYGSKKAFTDRQSKFISEHFSDFMKDLKATTEFKLPESDMKVDLESMMVTTKGKSYKIFFKFETSDLPYRITIAGDKCGIPPAEQRYFDDPRYKECAGVTWMWWNSDSIKDPLGEFANDNISTQNPHWRPYSEGDVETIEEGYKKFLELGGNVRYEKAINERYGVLYCSMYKGHRVMAQYRKDVDNRYRPIARATYIWLWKSSSSNNNNNGAAGEEVEEWTPYPLDDAVRLEKALIKENYEVEVVTPHNGTKVVNLVEMIQYDRDAPLNRREVKRVGTAMIDAFKKSLVLKPNCIPIGWDTKKEVKVSVLDPNGNEYKNFGEMLDKYTSSCRT